jgi:SAM-dependent methyltransferase
MSQYIFDNAAAQTKQRFQSLESLFDPRTIRALEDTGIEPGWRCLEVGAGSGSVATWLSARVGPSGHILVTDIDPSRLGSLDSSGESNVDVQLHDVGLDPLPKETFDLIHARLVLIHVPQRESALAQLVEALKPGGWIVIEDFDPTLIDRGFAGVDPEGYAAFDRVRIAMGQLMGRHGVDPVWARSLYRRFLSLGLTDVKMECHFSMLPGGSVGALLDQANFEQIRLEAVSAGLVTNAQVDTAIAVLDDPAFALSSMPMMTASGKKPV